MDEAVLRSLAKWPNVPDVYGWLGLDRRGNWLLKGERIGNQALKEFISRNYASDPRGCWYFQNGPQRVFVRLAYAPLVVHLEGEALIDHCGRAFEQTQGFVDDEGSVLLAGCGSVALLDDRDLAVFSDRAAGFAQIRKSGVPARFHYVGDPTP